MNGIEQVVEKMIGAAELGEMLGLGKRTVVRMAEQGRLPGIKLGKVWRFRPSDIERTISQDVKSRRSTERKDKTA